MIILDSTVKSLEVILAGAITTSQLDVVASYVDLTLTTFLSAEQDSTTNSTTAVTCVSAPAASTQRQVKYLTVINRDTVAATVTLRLNNSGTLRRLVTITLAVGSTLMYTDGEGYRVIDTTGGLVGTGSTASTAGLLVLLTADPASPVDDTFWAVRTGVSPTMTVEVKARIAGTTYSIAAITV